MKGSLIIELERLKNDRIGVWFLVLITLISIYFVMQGVHEFKSLEDVKEKFQEFERLKVENYINYEQYGSKGINVIADVSPVNIFFDIFGITGLIKANVDTTAIIEIKDSLKGERIFAKPVNFKGCSEFFFWGMSLLLLYFGLTVFKDIEEIKFLRKSRHCLKYVSSRFLILTIVVVVQFIVFYLIVVVNGINFSSEEALILVKYALYTFLALSFFYFAGSLILVMVPYRRLKTVISAFLAFILLVIIPNALSIDTYRAAEKKISDNELGISKLKALIDFEKKSKKRIEQRVDVLIKKEDNTEKRGQLLKRKLLPLFRELAENYMETSFVENRDRELSFFDDVAKHKGKLEKKALIFPSAYYLNILAVEGTVRGYSCQNDFVKGVLRQKYRFNRFYIRHRFKNNSEEKVQQFVAKDENIVKVEMKTPEFFTEASILLGLQIIILFGISSLIFGVRLRSSKSDSNVQYEKGMFYFQYFEKEDSRKNEFKSYKNKGAIGIDNSVAGILFYRGIKIEKIIKNLSHIYHSPISEIKKNLITLGLLNNKEVLCSEDVAKKIMIAVNFGKQGEGLVVVNDIVKKEDREFQNRFKKIIKTKLELGKTIIYLSSDCYSSETKQNALGCGDLIKIPNIEGINLR